MMLDREVYKQVANKLWSYTFNKTVDLNYCDTAISSFRTEESLKKCVQDWYFLNEKTYLSKYKVLDLKPDKELSLTLSVPLINTYQVLKSLECIKYQIELTTIEVSDDYHITNNEAISYEILRRLIESISKRIIEETPQYKEAKWGSV